MSYRLTPVEGTSDNPIIQLFNEAALSQETIEKLVGCIPEIKQFIQNAKLETKLELLTGKYVGKENVIYNREETLDWFVKYLEDLPVKIAEARRKQILDEAKKNVNANNVK